MSKRDDFLYLAGWAGGVVVSDIPWWDGYGIIVLFLATVLFYRLTSWIAAKEEKG